eukprot:1396445-Ditylum_brightwellii.AAC.1
MEAIQDQLKLQQDKAYQQNRHQNNNYQSYNQRRGRNSFRPRQQSAQQNFQREYCWMHGLCGCNSHDCETKMAGHKDTVTPRKKLGDSAKKCNC